MDHTTGVVSLVALLLLAAPLSGCDSTPPVGPEKRDAGGGSGKDDGGHVIELPDGSVGCVDHDGDGYGAGCALGEDCNDEDRFANAGMPEICGDGVDNDCDGETDEDGCGCLPGMVTSCYTSTRGTPGVGLCRAGLQRCGDYHQWGPCIGQVVAVDEVCDGEDNDCDGVVDDGVVNACGTCGDVPDEDCSDGFDNNCNGVVDEGCGTCDPDCDCSSGTCRCRPPTNQPCFSGPPHQAGVGECRAGLHDCEDKGGGLYEWGPCRGEVLAVPESCGNALDDDCDGETDEGCGTSCVPTTEVCDGRDNDCDGLVDEKVKNGCGGCEPVTEEICGDGQDNDCDGQIDEGCPCDDTQPCYGGPPATRNVGVCRAGTQTCVGGEISSWGPCVGQVLPGIEICGNGADDDCDGLTDELCGCAEGETRPCGSEVGECQRGTETCTGGVWGECAGQIGPRPEQCDLLDNDCDGLTDEGVLNACGQCPPNPCYDEVFDSEGELAQGTFDGVSQNPSNPLDPGCVPGNLCLDSTKTELPYIWIANTADRQVVKLDTNTGASFGPYPSHGDSPSRTAVVPSDGSVWVGNRSLSADATLPQNSNVVHLAADGSLICRADVLGIVRAVAVDANGDVWAGSYNDKKMYKISGTQVDTSQSPPRCQILKSLSVSARPYGAAVDWQNRVWVAGNSNWGNSFDPTVQALIEINADTDTVVASHVPPASLGCFSTYGIAVDNARRVWIGSYACQAVIWYDALSNTWGSIPIAEGTPRGIAVAPAVSSGDDDYVYTALSHVVPNGASDNHYVAKINRRTLQYTVLDLGPNGIHPIGIAVDSAMRIWAVALTSNRAIRINPATGQMDYFPTGNQPYTYSDMTGLQHSLYTRPNGTWAYDFDSGYAAPRWSQVTWSAVTPPGTTVSVAARSAATQAGLAGAAFGPEATASPADLTGLPHQRCLQVRLTLSTTDPNKTPVVQSLHITWER